MAYTQQQSNVGPDMASVGAPVGAPAYTSEKPAQPVVQAGQPQQPVVMAVPMVANPDYAFDFDAIKQTYQRYATINLDATKLTNPPDLSSRGLPDQTLIEVVTKVKKMKSKSNTNKAFLWTGCIFCCGIIGWLLVDRRSVGNKKLKHQLAPVLEAMNQELGAKNINVRFAWVQGTLRAYFR